MKPIIISANAGDEIAAGKFLKADGSGGVVENDTAGSEIGVAESSANTTTRPTVGVIKQGLVKVPAVVGAYNFGDKLEVASDGQSVTAYSSGVVVGTAAESKEVTTDDNLLLVYLNIA